MWSWLVEHWEFAVTGIVLGAFTIVGTIYGIMAYHKKPVSQDPTRSVFKGKISGSEIARVRARNAHHLVDGDIDKSRVEDVDYK
jgi:hypothetical protein